MRRSRPGQLELPLRFRQRQAIGRAHLALAGRIVTYTIKRSARRRAISILVDDNGVRIGVPWEASQSAIERLLHTHADWVLRKIDEWHVRRTPSRHWADGEPLMLLGRLLTLRLVPRESGVDLRGTELLVSAPAPGQPTVAEQVEQWLQGEALCCFRERVEHYRRLLDIESALQVKLSSARTRWGMCHASGRIHLNWRLIQMPLRLVDYVTAHEVAHLVEMNHSQRFWRAVERVVPDCATLRKELRRDAHRYLLV